MKQIIPSIIAENQTEFIERFEKIKNFKLIHLDLMDGKFVKNKSLNFHLKLPERKYQLHLMVKNPEKWIQRSHKYTDTIIFHIESCRNKDEVEKLIRYIKSKKKKPGIAINPNTIINKIKPYLNKVNLVLIMTVNPGKYGDKLLPIALKKIYLIRKLNQRVKIQLDGGINNKTINLGKNADYFTVGSYIQNSKNTIQAINNLKKLIR